MIGWLYMEHNHKFVAESPAYFCLVLDYFNWFNISGLQAYRLLVISSINKCNFVQQLKIILMDKVECEALFNYFVERIKYPAEYSK